MSDPVVVVAGALANKPGNGGEAWVRMSWVRGFQRLGCEVWFVEQIAPANCVDIVGDRTRPAESINRAWFDDVVTRFGIADRASLVAGDEVCTGAPIERVRDAVARSDLLVNISGHLVDPCLRNACRRAAFVDIDPGFTQYWHRAGATAARLDGHDLYFTIGELIGTSHCEIPTGELEWRHIRQPVVLDDWPSAPTAASDGRRRFTTVATWRGPYGPVEVAGRRFGVKVHEFRKYLELAGLVDADFEIALAIDPAEVPDLERLAGAGWVLRDPVAATGSVDRFRSFVADSDAEFSVAQGIYVETCSGWFSDRSVRYLASGRPVLVQDTGFSRTLPVGKGLVTFADLDQARRGAESILADYDAHRRSARELAESAFDSDVVLGRMLEICLDGDR